MTGLAPWVFLETGVVSLVLLFGAASVRLRTPSVRRRDGVVHDVWETAFLAGGPGRVVDAAIAGMHQDGRLAVGGPGVVTVRQAFAHDAVEAAVLDAVARTPGGALPVLRATARRGPAVQSVGDRLAARGLLRRPEPGRPWRRLASAQMTACAVLFFVAVLLSFAGSDMDAYAGPPPALRTVPAVVVGLVVASLCKKACTRRITKAGAFALRSARAARPRGGGAAGAWLPAAPAVALGGTALIADELLRRQFEEAHRATAAAAAGGSGSSGGSSCGGGGGSGSDGGSWCGSGDGGSGPGCGSAGSSCGGGSSCGSGASCGGGSGCGGGSSCGGGGCGGG
ncbi:TIGR04222 domain-containing membrane protein [Streptomyces lydicus]